MTKPYWRDIASERTQFQLDSLLGSGLELGEQLARKHGEFYPFAFVWPTGGDEPELVSVLEHRDQINFAIFRQYRPRRVRRGAALGDLGGRPTDAQVWDFESGAGLRG